MSRYADVIVVIGPDTVIQNGEVDIKGKDEIYQHILEKAEELTSLGGFFGNQNIFPSLLNEDVYTFHTTSAALFCRYVKNLQEEVLKEFLASFNWVPELFADNEVAFFYKHEDQEDFRMVHVFGGAEYFLVYRLDKMTAIPIERSSKIEMTYIELLKVAIQIAGNEWGFHDEFISKQECLTLQKFSRNRFEVIRMPYDISGILITNEDEIGCNEFLTNIFIRKCHDPNRTESLLKYRMMEESNNAD